MKELLQSILLDFPTFTFKARQKYLTEENFLESKNYIKESILDAIINKDRPYYQLLAGSQLYNWIMLHYTAGAPVSTITEMLKAFLYLTEDAFKKYNLNLTDLSYADIVNANFMVSMPDNGPLNKLLPLPIDSLYATNTLALAGFTKYSDQIIKSTYLNGFWLSDEDEEGQVCYATGDSSEMLMIFFMEHHKIPDAPKLADFTFSDKPLRIDLYKAMLSNNPTEVELYLNNYLKNWIKITKKSSYSNNHILNSHLEYDARLFTGYWAFDAAVVAYLKNIDDTPFHKYFYYPRDYADHVKQLNTQTKFNNTIIDPVRGGEVATKTGIWFCKNMLENDSHRKIFRTIGDILPKGFSEKGEYWWEYLGESDK